MKRFVFLALVLGCLGTGGASAQILPSVQIPDFSGFAVGALANVYWKAEDEAIYQQFAQRSVGGLTLQEIREISTRIAVARAKDSLVLDTAEVSLVWPGASQFRSGDWLSGSLFSLGNVAFLGTGLWGTWMLMPSAIRNSPLVALSSNNGVTLVDYLPAAAVGVGTFLTYQAWGLLAAGQAVPETKRRLDSGELTIGPHTIEPGGYGIVLRW